MGSQMLRILLSAPYMIPVFNRFKGYFGESGIEVDIPPVIERLSAEELMPFAGQVDGAICGDDRFNPEVLEAFSPRLKVISKWGTGVDSIDRSAAERLGIQVFRTPDAFTEAVADSVMAYMLAFARQVPWMDNRMKAGAWVKIPAVALHECTLGVIGVGRIGKSVLKRANAFGMRLLGNDIIEIDADFLKTYQVDMLPLEGLVRSSDFVSVNCDLNPTSRHLLNEESLGMMKSSAVLINTARGPIVDEQALIASLQAGEIAGAGLDVYEDEPLSDDSPLRSMENVLLGSHNANSSPSAWERVHRNTIRNLFLGLGLEPPEF
ncbi:MAG: phosphoglycerate dehydrogenase [Anaerolineales bacterium]